MISTNASLARATAYKCGHIYVYQEKTSINPIYVFKSWIRNDGHKGERKMIGIPTKVYRKMAQLMFGFN